MTNIDDLLVKHGESFVLDLNRPEIRNAFEQYARHRDEIQIYFTAMCLLPQRDKKITVPCRACFLASATLYEEMASLLREVAGEKVKPK